MQLIWWFSLAPHFLTGARQFWRFWYFLVLFVFFLKVPPWKLRRFVNKKEIEVKKKWKSMYKPVFLSFSLDKKYSGKCSFVDLVQFLWVCPLVLFVSSQLFECKQKHRMERIIFRAGKCIHKIANYKGLIMILYNVLVMTSISNFI